MRRISKEEFNTQRTEIRTILVKKPGGIGNVVLATPMLQALKGIFPKARLTVLVESEGAKQVLEANPYVEETIVTPAERYWSKSKHKYFAKMFELALRLRKKKYDFVVNGYSGYGGDGWRSCVFTFLVGGKYSVGYGKGLWRLLYSKSFEPRGELHEVDRNLDLVRSVAPELGGIKAELNLWLSRSDMRVAERFLRTSGIAEDSLTVGIHPGSGPMTYKRWDPAKFAELADRLTEKWDAKVIMFGGNEETELADDILLRMKGNAVNAVGKTSLKRTAALIQKCKVFISNDTGLMHVAAAVRVPVVAIFGPTNFRRTSPYGNSHAVVTSKLPCAPCYRGYGAKCDDITCLNRISVEEVITAVERLLCM
ncbi:MAG: lipopolysaccharide heptosyltransferase II [Planctomycetota bacterium]|jgi:lipopolysaccharide heptosyltransferase II